MRIFTAVYRNRSFTKAAEELYTSQPTVSEHIRNLEGQLDCRLFDRLGRTIVPTLEAELLYPRALAILDDLKKLEDEITVAGKTVAGRILLAASTIPSAFILPKKVAAFNKVHPDASFEVRTYDSGQCSEKVATNEILAGVVGAKTSNEKLDYQPFMEDELVLAAPVSRNIKKRIPARSLVELPFILREKGSGTRRSLEAYLGEKGLGVDGLNVCAVLGSSTAVVEAVKANLGVSILSRHAIADAVKFKQVQVIDIEDFAITRNFYTVTARKRSLPYNYQIFLRFLHSHGSP